MASTADVLKQIDRALDTYESWRTHSEDLSHLEEEAWRIEVMTQVVATLERLAPAGSPYVRSRLAHITDHVGSLRALRSDYADGYPQTLNGLLRAEVSADFLEMAAYLLEQGYKDAAAVLVGGVLEEHLRTVCQRRSIAIEVNDRPKKAEAMNDDLCAAGAYNLLSKKNVTAWLDLRNKAAHGKYAEYDHRHVDLMLQGVRAFVATEA
jgi:hypothetical protein